MAARVISFSAATATSAKKAIMREVAPSEPFVPWLAQQIRLLRAEAESLAAQIVRLEQDVQSRSC